MQPDAWPPAKAEKRLRETEDSLHSAPCLCPGFVSLSLSARSWALRVAPGQLCPPTGLGEGSGALPSPWQLPTSWPVHPGGPTCGRVLEVHGVGSMARPQHQSLHGVELQDPHL